MNEAERRVIGFLHGSEHPDWIERMAALVRDVENEAVARGREEGRAQIAAIASGAIDEKRVYFTCAVGGGGAEDAGLSAILGDDFTVLDDGEED